MLEAGNSTLKSSRELVSYWQGKLTGILPLLDLPTARSRQAVTTDRSAIQSIFLAEPLVNSLEIIARDRDVDLFVTLLAVFKVLIYRYVDRPDILMGTLTRSNQRSTTDLLVLRTNLSGNPTFTQVLARISQVVAEATEYQDVGFDRLIDALDIDRSASYHPLFQVMFSFGPSNLDFPPLTKSLGLLSAFVLLEPNPVTVPTID